MARIIILFIAIAILLSQTVFSQKLEQGLKFILGSKNQTTFVSNQKESLKNIKKDLRALQAQARWYSMSWLYRQKVTILASSLPHDLKDFQITVDLSEFDPKFFKVVLEDGADIVITQANSKKELPREILHIDKNSKKGELIFNAPFLSSVVNTEFYIYYGNRKVLNTKSTLSQFPGRRQTYVSLTH